METNKIYPPIEKDFEFCKKYAKENCINFKDKPGKERTTEQKIEDITRGKYAECVVKQEFNLRNIKTSDVYFGKSADSGIDLEVLKNSINVKCFKGENVDNGRDTRLIKNSWDKGEWYLCYKIYKDGSYSFIGFIESKLVRNDVIVLLKQHLDSNFENLLLKLHQKITYN